MFEKATIIFVCNGKMGLSIMAEGLVRSRLTDNNSENNYKLHSAISPKPSGDMAIDRSFRLKSGQCIDLSGQALTQELVDQADLILAMTQMEIQAVKKDFPGAEKRTFLLSEMTGCSYDPCPDEILSKKTFDQRIKKIKDMVNRGFESIIKRAESLRTFLMSRVGLSSFILDFELVPPSISEIFSLFKKAGIRFVDLSGAENMYSERIYSREEIEQLALLLESNDLKCEMAHGFENSRVHALTTGEKLDQYVAVQSNRIERCAFVGGDTMVLHMPGIFWHHLGLPLQDALKQSTIALDRLRPLCEKLGVTLAIENYVEDDDLKKLDYYYNYYPESFITFCLDVGHANTVPGLFEKLKPYASRLSSVHLHDNLGKDDDHQTPFSGTIDWKTLLLWLQEIGYTRSLNFEVFYKRGFFTGDPIEYIDYAGQQIRKALHLVPDIITGPNIVSL